MKKKTYWVPAYECQRCKEVFENTEHRYNTYGAKMFPDVDAPREMKHQCKRGMIGLATLVGLNEISNS